MRLTIAMHFACIPVITSDQVVQPLQGMLPYQVWPSDSNVALVGFEIV